MKPLTTSKTEKLMSPWILRYGSALPEKKDVGSTIFRFDTQSKVSQVNVNGEWIDRLAAAAEDDPQPTTFTRVRHETTDDD